MSEGTDAVAVFLVFARDDVCIKRPMRIPIHSCVKEWSVELWYIRCGVTHFGYGVEVGTV